MKTYTTANTALTIAERRKNLNERSFKVAADIRVQTLMVANREAEWLRAPGIDEDRALLYLHGGGYTMGSLTSHRALAGEMSRAAQSAVLLLDYRLAPEHPFPAAVEDAVASLQWLLGQGFNSTQIGIVGDSAGGGLAAATLVAARDQSLAMPAVAVCLSPWADLTCSNESYKTRAGADPTVDSADLTQMANAYLQGTEPMHPLASPNFADLQGLPPLLIHVGADEVLLDDAIQLDAKAKADGVHSTLEIWEDMIHVWHALYPMLPEGQAGIERVGVFLRQKWGAR